MLNKNKILSLLFIFLCLHIGNVMADQENQHNVKYPRQTRVLLDSVNPQNMWDNLSILTQFPDRSSLDQNGVDAANWIKSQLEILIKNSPRKDITIYTLNAYPDNDKDWPDNPKQPSIILKIGDSTKPAVVIGAHMDTKPLDTNSCSPQNCQGSDRMPGADDDGSGTVAVLEEARVLLNSNILFDKPVYLIFYAAEELGMEGSRVVVDDFVQKKIAVEGVMQLDMIGLRYRNDPTIWLGSSKPDPEAPSSPTNSPILSAKVIALGHAYLSVPVRETEGDDMSDHLSWMRKDFKTVYLHERNCSEGGNCSGPTHTADDTMDKLSLEHIANHLKLALAFTVEMAEPVSAK